MSKNTNTNGLMNAQDALVAIMVAGGASDENISNFCFLGRNGRF